MYMIDRSTHCGVVPAVGEPRKGEGMEQLVFEQKERHVAWLGEPLDWSAAVGAARTAVLHGGPEMEACGIVEDGKIIVKINVSRDPGTFAFSHKDCIAVYEAMESGSLEGIWHSHPRGHKAPSERDWLNHPRNVPLYIVVLENATDATVLRFDRTAHPT